ncbi:DNA repair photolyase [Bacillus sp. V2I10]|nr:DNA repair photolyase [Bacillus sp. V2I10]
MTIETDSETIRKHFTPEAPPILARFKTLQKLADAGISTLFHLSFMTEFQANNLTGTKTK